MEKRVIQEPATSCPFQRVPKPMSLATSAVAQAGSPPGLASISIRSPLCSVESHVTLLQLLFAARFTVPFPTSPLGSHVMPAFLHFNSERQGVAPSGVGISILKSGTAPCWELPHCNSLPSCCRSPRRISENSPYAPATCLGVVEALAKSKP